MARARFSVPLTFFRDADSNVRNSGFEFLMFERYI